MRKKNSSIRISPIALVAAAAVAVLVMAFPGPSQAAIIIDIVKSPRKLPIAVQELSGLGGRELADIIETDLAATGLFTPIDRSAFIEYPGHAFKRENWSVLGAEVVVKGFLKTDADTVEATVYSYDVFDGNPILKKQYKTSRTLTRTLAHKIASDIYEKFTNHRSVFTTKIAYISDEGGTPALFLMDWDGERRTPLNVSAEILVTPRWSPDGEKLLFSSYGKRRWDIMLLDLKTMALRKTYSSKGTNLAGDFLPGGEAFLMSSSSYGTPDIFSFGLADSKLTRLTRDMGIEVSPTSSPDGNNIAFASDVGGSAQIYTMDKIGYNKMRITYESKYNTAPAWSPTGEVIAYSGSYEGRNQIFLVRPDSSGTQMLTRDGNNEDPSFSPDGRFIVFTSDRDGKQGIYRMRINGEDQKRLTPPYLRAYSPRWSPG